VDCKSYCCDANFIANTAVHTEVVFEGLSLWDLHLVNWKELLTFQESLLPLSSASNKVCCLYFVGYLCHGTTFHLKVPYLNEVCSCHVLIFLYT